MLFNLRYSNSKQKENLTTKLQTSNQNSRSSWLALYNLKTANQNQNLGKFGSCRRLVFTLLSVQVDWSVLTYWSILWRCWNLFPVALFPVACRYRWQRWKWIEIWKNWPVFGNFDGTSSKHPQEICYGQPSLIKLIRRSFTETFFTSKASKSWF